MEKFCTESHPGLESTGYENFSMNTCSLAELGAVMALNTSK